MKRLMAFILLMAMASAYASNPYKNADMLPYPKPLGKMLKYTQKNEFSKSNLNIKGEFRDEVQF